MELTNRERSSGAVAQWVGVGVVQKKNGAKLGGVSFGVGGAVQPGL